MLSTPDSSEQPITAQQARIDRAEAYTRRAQEELTFLEGKLALVAKLAPALREAGIEVLDVNGLRIELRAHVPASLPNEELSKAPTGRSPEAYGLPPGTKMPSLKGRRG